MSEKNDPYYKVLDVDASEDPKKIIDAIKKGMDSINIEKLQQQIGKEKKGLLKGYFKGRKKFEFKAMFKTENNKYHVKISHRFPFKEEELKNVNLRSLPEEGNAARLIVKFWDTLYDKLNLGLAPGFGNTNENLIRKKKIFNDEIQQQKVNSSSDSEMELDMDLDLDLDIDLDSDLGLEDVPNSKQKLENYKKSIREDLDNEDDLDLKFEDIEEYEEKKELDFSVNSSINKNESIKFGEIDEKFGEFDDEEVKLKNTESSSIYDSLVTKKKKNVRLDPNFRTILNSENKSRHEIYNIITNAMVLDDFSIEDANEEKGIVIGIFKKNSKFSLKAMFKLKNDNVLIKINHNFSLDDINNPNIRQSDFRSASKVIVRFWDEIYSSFGEIHAPGFGKVEEDKNKILGELENYFRNWLSNEFNSEPELKKKVMDYNLKQEKIRRKYKWELKTIESKSRWKQSLIFAVELFLDARKKNAIVLTVNSLDMKTFTKLPIEINFFIRLPRAMPRELTMTYKCQWSSSQFDDVSQKMINYLNFEIPSIEKKLKTLFSNTYTYRFLFEEIINDKGKKTKLKHDQILLDTINVTPIINPMEDEDRYLYVLRYLLDINQKTGEYGGLINIADTITIMSDLFGVLKKFFVETESDRALKQKRDKKAKQEKPKTAGINRCPKCNWLLSGTSTKCPMCGTEINSVERKSESFGIKSDGFSASSSLLGAKEDRKTSKLMQNLDNAFSILDEVDDRRKEIVNDNFKIELKSSGLGKSIDKIATKDETIKKAINEVFDSNEIGYNREREVIGRYLIKLKGFEIPYIYVVLEKIEMNNDEVFPVLVNYIITAPYIPHYFSYAKVEIGKRGNKEDLRWEIDEGRDPPIIKALNVTSEDFIKILKDAYLQEDATKYIEPILDKKDRVKGILHEIDLYPIIRIEPFLKNKTNPRTIVVMRQFLNYQQTGYIPFKKVFGILETIYGIIEIFKEEYKEKGESTEKESFQYEFSLLDKKLEQSKYSKKNTTTDTIEDEEDQKNDTEIISGDEELDIDISDEHFDLEKMGIKEDSEPSIYDSIFKNKQDFKLLERKNIDYYKLTTINKEKPNFNIEEKLSDEDLRIKMANLYTEISTLKDLAENEIEMLRSKAQTFFSCKKTLNSLLDQIKEKQFLIRAYEYEINRVKI